MSNVNINVPKIKNAGKIKIRLKKYQNGNILLI